MSAGLDKVTCRAGEVTLTAVRRKGFLQPDGRYGASSASAKDKSADSGQGHWLRNQSGSRVNRVATDWPCGWGYWWFEVMRWMMQVNAKPTVTAYRRALQLTIERFVVKSSQGVWTSKLHRLLRHIFRMSGQHICRCSCSRMAMSRPLSASH